MNSSGNILDVETLAKLTYERSKFWAKILDRYSKLDDGEDYSLIELESVFKNEKEEDEDEASMDTSCEAEEVDDEDDVVLGDITNYSIVKCGGMDNNKFTLVDNYGNIDNNAELQDLLNHTLPILTEHHRQLRESGVDRVLNTFDANKIEDKVGGWLRRNETACAIPNFKSTETNKVRNSCKSRKSSDDDESLHSVDTAQYIRSSRTHHTSSKKKAACTTTMTIKTFRMVKSKRDALRQKYACAEHDEHHLEEVRCRRQRRCDQQKQQKHIINGYQEYYSRGSYQLSNDSLQQHQSQRRKQLRKRRVINSQDFLTDMSSTDEEYVHCCNNYGCTRNPIKSPKCRILHCQRGLQVSYNSTSPLSSHNYNHMLGHKTPNHKQRSIDAIDSRPCRQESECQCRTQKILCKRYRHIVNSSTEEWLVENCLTPLKSELSSARTPACSAKTKAPVAKKTTTKANNNCKLEYNSFEISEGSNNNDSWKSAIKTKTTKRIENKKPKVKVKPKNSTNEMSSYTNSDFQKDLQLAIEASKEQFLLEKSLKSAGSSCRKTISSKKAITSPPTRPSLDISQTQAKTLAKHMVKKEFEEKKSKRVSILKDECEKNKYSELEFKVENDKLEEMERTLKPQPKFAKLRKLVKATTKNNNEDTFLLDAKNICNSTALPNDSTANENQFREKPVKQNELKKSIAVSTTNDDAICIKDSPTPSPSHKTYDDNDCTVVTSTTCGDNMPQRNTNKGIIIYTPNNHNCTNMDGSNGYFNVTQKNLAAVIGEKNARRFLKYYVGRRRFDSSSTIYFRPPNKNATQLAIADSNVPSGDSEHDNDDDSDILDCVGEYGELYESFNKDF